MQTKSVLHQHHEHPPNADLERRANELQRDLLTLKTSTYSRPITPVPIQPVEARPSMIDQSQLKNLENKVNYALERINQQASSSPRNHERDFEKRFS